MDQQMDQETARPVPPMNPLPLSVEEMLADFHSDGSQEVPRPLSPTNTSLPSDGTPDGNTFMHHFQPLPQKTIISFVGQGSMDIPIASPPTVPESLVESPAGLSSPMYEENSLAEVSTLSLSARTNEFQAQLSIFQTDLNVLFSNWFPLKGSKSNRREKMRPFDPSWIPNLLKLEIDDMAVLMTILNCAKPFLANGTTGWYTRLQNLRPLLVQACVSLESRFALVTYLVEWFQEAYCQNDSYSNPGMLKLMKYFILDPSKSKYTPTRSKNPPGVKATSTGSHNVAEVPTDKRFKSLLHPRELGLWYHAHLAPYDPSSNSILQDDNVDLTYMADCYTFFSDLQIENGLADPLVCIVDEAESQMPKDAPEAAKFILAYLLDCRSAGMALLGTFPIKPIMQMVNPEMPMSQYFCLTAFPVEQNNLNSRKTVKIFDEMCLQGVSWYKCAYIEFGRKTPNICVIPKCYDVGLPEALKVNPAFDIGTFFCGHCSDEAMAKMQLGGNVCKFSYTFNHLRLFDNHCDQMHSHDPPRYTLPCGCNRIYGISKGEIHRHVCLTCTCGKKFETVEEKRFHCEEAPNSLGSTGCHYCSFCDEFFLNPDALETHIQEYCSLCSSCGKEYPFHASKNERTRKHHRVSHGKKCFQCSYCNRSHNDPQAVNKCPRICLRRALHPQTFLSMG